MPEHSVKDVRVVAKGPGLLVREFNFAPGEAIAWHRHSQVTDLTYGLQGRITLQMRGPDEALEIAAGQSNSLPPGRPHRLINQSDAVARILLIQHGGQYDFIEVDP